MQSTETIVPDCRPAFTIIELLAVIAIIAILGSLLLNGLAYAREKIRQIKCMNNLKQIHLAAMVYVNDCDGHLPCPLGFDFSGNDQWVFQLHNYVRSPPQQPEPYWPSVPAYSPVTFVCPSIPVPRDPNIDGDMDQSLPSMNTDSNYVTTIIGYADYAMNAWLTNHYLDGHYSTAPLPTDETATLSRISAPANKMFMVDGISTYTYQPITSPHYQQSFGTYLSWQRHRGRLNVIYVDGHAVNMLRDDVPLNWNDPFWAGN